MFEDKEVDGIICIRGGYGTGRILDLINYRNHQRKLKGIPWI